ncbi:MAG: hypothetical protein Nk1A_8590 [Endomicrobiia bacterium]|nr:MAG: hypothetical protein Nk1A_8590 [Endomicrobiia bacterium]
MLYEPLRRWKSFITRATTLDDPAEPTGASTKYPLTEVAGRGNCFVDIKTTSFYMYSLLNTSDALDKDKISNWFPNPFLIGRPTTQM